MTAYRLINAGPSPYGRKVAVALMEKGLSFETIVDEPWGQASVTPDHSPLQQLPILLTSDGEAIYDSSFILDWLEIVHPEPALLPNVAPERIAALRLRMLGERLMEIAQSLIFELARAEPGQAWIARQLRKIEGGLVELERLLGGPSPPADDAIHLGHIAVATTLLVWEFVVEDGMTGEIAALRWRGVYPALTRMVEQVEDRRSFRTTSPRPMQLDIAATVS